MRWPRAGIVVGVIGLVLLGAGWWLAGVGDAGTPAAHTPRAPSASVIGTHASAPLLKALQQYLALSDSPVRRKHVPPLTRIYRMRSQGTACAVAAGGFCSIQPCVVFTGHALAAVSVAGSPTGVLKPSVQGGRTCQGQPAPQRTLRVAGF